MKYTVPKSWPGETCVILAGGPSLERMDLSSMHDHDLRVITINDSWRLWPRADVLYFCDEEWYLNQWDLNFFSTRGRAHFRDTISRGFWLKGGEELKRNPAVLHVPFTGATGLETDPSGLRHGSNSTYASINLAYHYGVKRIILLGADMRVVNGRSHWHLEKRPGNFAGILKNTMLPLFTYLVEPLRAAGVEVINSTPDSALICWRYLPLEEALAQGETISPSQAVVAG